VEALLRGINATDAGIKAAKTTVFYSMQHNFNRVCNASRASTQRYNTHMPTVRLLVGSVAMSAQSGPTLTVVAAVEVVAPLGAAKVLFEALERRIRA
jgi:hypothetical protein